MRVEPDVPILLRLFGGEPFRQVFPACGKLFGIVGLAFMLFADALYVSLRGSLRSVARLATQGSLTTARMRAGRGGEGYAKRSLW